MNKQNKNFNKKLRSGERQVRNDLHKMQWNQKWRYCKALNYIKQENTVLDIGTGCGSGAYILSLLAKKVIGIDDSEEAIKFAKMNWSTSNIEFFCQDALNLQGKYDIITAFELIEHIKDDIKLFIKFKQLNPKYIIISVPHISVPLSRSKWHWKHYKQKEINKLFNNIGYKVIVNDIIKFGNLAIFAVAERK